MMRLLALLAVLTSTFGPLAATAQEAHASGGCPPPKGRFLPTDDAELARYADLIAVDFERYFIESSDYFACVDATRLIELERAQRLSERHRRFLERLDRLGLLTEATSEQGR